MPGIHLTRFAPSPTGHLHLGNIYSALYCQHWADQHKARVLLRIEDIDSQRCKQEYNASILEDLTAIGLQWEEPVLKQSKRMDIYQTYIDQLNQMGVLFPCFCTRKNLGYASDEHYPGTCKHLSPGDIAKKKQDLPFSLRLNAEKALTRLKSGKNSAPLRQGKIDDVILVRKDIGTSYHLSVCVDDALQGITHIIRGTDLEDATPVHQLIQHLLGFPVPEYIHHPLVRDTQGQRMGKRYGSTTFKHIVSSGISAEEIRRILLNCIENPKKKAKIKLVDHYTVY